jgi:hypothetical protein
LGKLGAVGEATVSCCDYSSQITLNGKLYPRIYCSGCPVEYSNVDVLLYTPPLHKITAPSSSGMPIIAAATHGDTHPI